MKNIDALFNCIKTCLLQKIPFSLVRIGDGEAFIINGEKDKFYLEFTLKRQLGYVPPPAQIKTIQAQLLEAIEESSILGIPAHKMIKDKDTHWPAVIRIFQNSFDLDKKDLTSADCHTKLLTSGYLEQLLTNADTLNYISCRDITQQLKKKFNIKNINFYQIPPEVKFTSYSGENHFPHHYNNVKKWIEKIQPKGQLCLTGSGIFKVYTTWFKQNGGVALDIGSVFDTWAGRVTRGAKRGLDVVDKESAL